MEFQLNQSNLIEKYVIDGYEVRISNPRVIIIKNIITLKKCSFKTDFQSSLQEKIYKISRELMIVNRITHPKYKSLFNSLIETMKFIEKLKHMVR